MPRSLREQWGELSKFMARVKVELTFYPRSHAWRKEAVSIYFLQLAFSSSNDSPNLLGPDSKLTCQYRGHHGAKNNCLFFQKEIPPQSRIWFAHPSWDFALFFLLKRDGRVQSFTNDFAMSTNTPLCPSNLTFAKILCRF
jgi:hypothetical protein